MSRLVLGGERKERSSDETLTKGERSKAVRHKFSQSGVPYGLVLGVEEVKERRKQLYLKGKERNSETWNIRSERKKSLQSSTFVNKKKEIILNQAGTEANQ